MGMYVNCIFQQNNIGRTPIDPAISMSYGNTLHYWQPLILKHSIQFQVLQRQNLICWVMYPRKALLATGPEHIVSLTPLKTPSNFHAIKTLNPKILVKFRHE